MRTKRERRSNESRAYDRRPYDDADNTPIEIGCCLGLLACAEARGAPDLYFLSEAAVISIDVDALAERVAQLVVEKLRAANFSDMIDQSESPLGRRKHIALVRKGGPGVARIGRRYLAHRDVVQRAMTENPVVNSSEPDGNAFLRKIGL